MSQRLIRKTIGDLTTRDGLAVTALRGSEPGDDDGANTNGDNGSSGSSDDGSGADDGGDTGQQDDKSGDGKDEDSEKEALRNRMKAADRRAAELEKRLKEFEDKDKSESQRLADDLKSAQETITGLQQALREAKVHNAFLTSNEFTWQDPETALRLADLSEVVDDEGEVNTKALKRALKDLADSKPFLVKTQTDQQSNNGSGQSGSGVGSGRKGGKQEFDENDLLRRYSSLAQRS